MTRRKIGSAYEESPAERTGRWVADNFLRLISAAAGFASFWIVVDLFISLLNFINRGGMGDAPGVFSHDHPVVLGIKVIGAPLVALLILKPRH